MGTKLKNISYSAVTKLIMFIIAVFSLTVFLFSFYSFWQYEDMGIIIDYGEDYKNSRVMRAYDEENGTEYFKDAIDLRDVLIEKMLDLDNMALVVQDNKEHSIQEILGIDVEDYIYNGLEFYIVDNDTNEIVGYSSDRIDSDTSNITQIISNVQSQILPEGVEATVQEYTDYSHYMYNNQAYFRNEPYNIESVTHNYVSSKDVNSEYLGNILATQNTEVYYHDYTLYTMYTIGNVLVPIDAFRETQRSAAIETIVSSVISSILFVCVMLYFIIVSGRRPNVNNIVIKKIDKIYFDILLFIGIVVFSFLTFWLVLIFEEFTLEGNVIFFVFLGYSFLTTLLVVYILTNFVIKIKSKRFLESLFAFVFVRFIYRKTIKSAHKFFIKDTTLSIKLLLVLGVFFGFFALVVPGFSIFIIVLYFWHLIVSIKLVKAIKDVSNNEKFVAENERLRNIPYNLAFKQLENISKNTAEIYSKGLKAQNTKTELITNVSHDLRTPLTSLVGYIDLLDKRGNDYDEETQEYIRILKEKSNRMTQMVGDLFDLAKTSSGDIQLELSKLNVKKLIEQSISELDDVILDERKLQLNLDDSLFILADGNKMYRVIQNIIDNALKYSMEGTRIYIEAFKNKDDEVQIEFKNIANYAMNFNCDDITERFTRGDKSRTAEGSGLGLAIAETYTTLNNGNFNVVVDGDLFKIVMKFNQI